MKNTMYTTNFRIKMFVSFVLACVFAIAIATLPVFARNIAKECTIENKDIDGNVVVSKVLPEIEIFKVTYEISTLDEGENLGILNNVPRHSEQIDDLSGTVTIDDRTFKYETVELNGYSFVKYTQVENQYGYLWMLGLLLVSVALIGVLAYFNIKDKKQLLYDEKEQ